MAAPNPLVGHDDARDALASAYALLVEIARRARPAPDHPQTDDRPDDGADEAAA